MAAERPITSFRLLSFDIYGTLIDWEKGIFEALKPLVSRLPDHPIKSDPHAICSAFSKHERRMQREIPSMPYGQVLKASYECLALEWQLVPELRDGLSEEELLGEEASLFASSIAAWPAFPDTIDAMRLLRKHFKLVPLSNVDRDSFAKTLHGPLADLHLDLGDEAFFSAVYTAQDIGSYKPDLRNFEYLISHVKEEFGVEKEDILHVAQGLYYDHEPANHIGLNSAWIARGEDGESGMGGSVKQYVEEGRVAFGWKFNNLSELADAVEKEAMSQ